MRSLDGYRVQVHLQDGRVTLYTRSGLDWTKRFPTIAADIGRLPAGKLVIDGEVVSADTDGRPNFGALQDDLKRRRFEKLEPGPARLRLRRARLHSPDVRALHLPTDLARACEIVSADVGRSRAEHTAALQHLPDHDH
jgi:hypothetical protein